MTIQEAISSAQQELEKIYSPGESQSISEWLVENITGIERKNRAVNRNIELTSPQIDVYQSHLARLLQHEPIQYVLHESWFCGLRFYVDKHVLIPRPETEELVEWIISNCKFPVDELRILDIGSGSGCIPISLKRRIRKAEVWSCDISSTALAIAKKNAANLGTEVNFIELDFLNAEKRNGLPGFDIIVSNPPYVPESNKYSMAPNVIEFEPRTALFVPDDDPFLFYRAIARFGKTNLNTGGQIYAEIHEDLGKSVAELFEATGYKVELKKDMQGKERMLNAKY